MWYKKKEIENCFILGKGINFLGMICIGVEIVVFFLLFYVVCKFVVYSCFMVF